MNLVSNASHLSIDLIIEVIIIVIISVRLVFNVRAWIVIIVRIYSLPSFFFGEITSLTVCVKTSMPKDLKTC